MQVKVKYVIIYKSGKVSKKTSLFLNYSDIDKVFERVDQVISQSFKGDKLIKLPSDNGKYKKYLFSSNIQEIEIDDIEYVED